MPVVTEQQIEEAKKKAKEVDTSGIQEKVYGTTKVWIGSNGASYSSYSEALDSIQIQKEQADFKKLGLNEHGQTPEQVAQNKKRSELYKKKEAILKQAADVDEEIRNVGTEKKPETHKKK